MIAIGYDPIEYEPRNWNSDRSANIVVIDSMRAEIDKNYQPERELVGDISQTLDFLLPYMKGYSVPEESKATWIHCVRLCKNAMCHLKLPKIKFKVIH